MRKQGNKMSEEIKNLGKSFKKYGSLFDYLVKDMYDWKDPIRSYIPIKMWKEYKFNEAFVSAAVNFFTATPATVTYDGYVGDEGYWVESVGYYNGPASGGYNG